MVQYRFNDFSDLWSYICLFWSKNPPRKFKCLAKLGKRAIWSNYDRLGHNAIFLRANCISKE